MSSDPTLDTRFGFGIILMAARLAQHRKTPDDPNAIMSYDEPSKVQPASRSWAVNCPDTASHEFYQILDRIAAGEKP